MIALLLASVLFGQTETGRGLGGAQDGSSYTAGNQGLSAIYQVLAEQKQARRWERQVTKLPPEVAVLVVWDVGRLPESYYDDLLQWTADGGRLVIAGPLDGARQIHQRSPQPALSASAHPLTAGLSQVDTGSGVLGEFGDGWLPHLAREDGTPVLVSRPHGQGEIYWSADTEWLANGRIAQADNLSLALRLLTPPTGGQVAFDEYVHGYRAADRWWQLLRGPLQLFLLQLIAALALLYWAFGVRFGSPRSLPAITPRSAVEYVYSMSQLYRRAGARRLVRSALYRSLHLTFSRLLGGAAGLTHAEIARRAAGPAGLPPDQIQRLLDQTGPDRKEEPSEAALLQLAREATDVQRSVQHARYRDQRPPGTGTG